MARPEWIEVGRVSRPHGVRGEVRVVSDSDNPERFAPGSTLHARSARMGVAGAHSEARRRLTIESVRGDEDFPIVAFEGVDDRDAAEALRGYVLEVRSDDLPDLPDDEYYPFELEGLEVRDADGTALGKVAEVIESPAHAILSVTLAAGGKVLVPFVSAAVPDVTIAGGYLVVALGYMGESGEGTAS